MADNRLRPLLVRQPLREPETTARKESVSRLLAALFMHPTIHSHKSATQPSATQGTAPGSQVGTNRGQEALWCGRQRKEFIRDAQDEFRPVGYTELVVKPLHVAVNRVRRHAEVGGDGELGAVVENAAQDLQFTRG